MKKIASTVLLTLALITTTNLFSQVPPPPPSSHGDSGNKEAGGGAPIGSGLLILLGLGAAYGGKKIYDSRKETLED